MHNHKDVGFRISGMRKKIVSEGMSTGWKAAGKLAALMIVGSDKTGPAQREISCGTPSRQAPRGAEFIRSGWGFGEDRVADDQPIILASFAVGDGLAGVGQIVAGLLGLLLAIGIAIMGLRLIVLGPRRSSR